MSDLVEWLRISLAGVAKEESGGDNLAILLASYFEPRIEDEELDDSGTWKQGALDASDKVLDAIHAHYATALEAKDKELAALKECARKAIDAGEVMIGTLRCERDEAREALKAAIDPANLDAALAAIGLCQTCLDEGCARATRAIKGKKQ